jgi:dihydrofolate reductase
MTAVSCCKWRIIVARDIAGGIGYRNRLPWPRLVEDFKHFRTTTTQTKDKEKQNAIIMGRKTWESFEGRGPLPGRMNIVVSGTLDSAIEGITVCRSFAEVDEVLASAENVDRIEKVFVIGGIDVFVEAINRGAKTIWLTFVQDVFPCDRYLPENFLNNYFLQHFRQYEEKNITFTISKFNKKKVT